MAMTYTARMTTAVKNEIRKTVNSALRELLSDPDFGMHISAAFKRRLGRSIKSASAGRTRSLQAFLKKN